jgi:hypothetical protein
MTDLENLVKDLNVLCDRLDQDYNINFGGCCFVAYLMMKHFEKIGLHPTLIIESDCEDIDGDDFLDCVHTRSGNCQGLKDQTCYHYFVYIPEVDEYVNAGEFYEEYLYKFRGLSAKDVHWIYRTGDWNSNYDRKNSPMVGRKIAQVFRKYEDLYQE